MTKQVITCRTHPGHPWIFSNEILKVLGEPKAGDTVEAWHKAGRRKEFIGLGFYNPHSLISVRLFSTEENFTQGFVMKRLGAALAFRRQFIEDESLRLVHGESDGLPGLIIDKYANGFVLQINCLGMDLQRDTIVAALQEMFQPDFIYEKSDTNYRKLEGLNEQTRLLAGQLPASVPIIQDGIHFLVDVKLGQKTGFYFDQRDNRRRVRELARGKKVLDLFCYTGGFSLYALKGGAESVTGVDSSNPAIELAMKNGAMNKMEGGTVLSRRMFLIFCARRTKQMKGLI